VGFIRKTRCGNPGTKTGCILDTKAKQKHASKSKSVAEAIGDAPAPRSRSSCEGVVDLGRRRRGLGGGVVLALLVTGGSPLLFPPPSTCSLILPCLPSRRGLSRSKYSGRQDLSESGDQFRVAVPETQSSEQPAKPVPTVMAVRLRHCSTPSASGDGAHCFHTRHPRVLEGSLHFQAQPRVIRRTAPPVFNRPLLPRLYSLCQHSELPPHGFPTATPAALPILSS